MFPRPPKLPPRPREVAMQVVQQKISGAVDLNVLLIEKSPARDTRATRSDQQAPDGLAPQDPDK